jgi:hypothetical protein
MISLLLKKCGQLVIFISLVAYLSSCIDCDSTTEPKAAFTTFTSGTPLKFKKIYAANAKDVAFSATPSRDIRYQEDIILPVDLNSKTTKYILESDTQTDSITVAYTVVPNYTKKCGYTFTLKDVQFVEARSSFKNTQINIKLYSQLNTLASKNGESFALNLTY